MDRAGLHLIHAERRQDTAERIDRHGPRLEQLLGQLYRQHPDWQHQRARLQERIMARIAARPGHLLALDARRAGSPGWYLAADMLGYCAYVDRLGGTLAGVRGRIPFLQRLGVRYLHLLPFLKARAGDNDGGFAVADFESVEPALGTMRDLEELGSALRTADISLCADFVLNHVADDHPWAREALAGDPEYLAYFRLFPDRTGPDVHERSLRQIFPVAAPGNFTWRDEIQSWVWTTFYPFQWDLNYENPAVFVAIADALLGLANQGVEIFRLDSVGFLWKREGTDCMNQPETHWIVQALRAVLDIAAPAVLLKAEAIVPTRDLPPYFGLPELPGQECQMAYHSSLMAAGWAALAQSDATIVRAVLAETPTLPQGCCWLTYVRCHDDIGWRVLEPTLQALGLDPHVWLRSVAAFYNDSTDGYADGKAFQAANAGEVPGTNGMAAALAGLGRAETDETFAAARDRLLLLYALSLGVGGLPLIYMGDELGQGNDRSATSLERQKTDTRWLQRPAFDTAALDRIEDPETRTGAIFQGMRRLISLRSTHSELAADRSTLVLPARHPALLALLRGQQMLVLLNWSDQAIDLADEWPGLCSAVAASSPSGQTPLWRDALSGASSSGDAVLPPWGHRFLVREDDLSACAGAAP
jgi:amylosucrase